MNPRDIEVLLRRLNGAMEASHRLHQELLGTIEQLLREQQPLPESVPASPAPLPDKRPGKLYTDTRGAAEHLGISPRTLEKWRVRGGGPLFLKTGGGVRYEIAELDRWMVSRRRQSTSDPGVDK